MNEIPFEGAEFTSVEVAKEKEQEGKATLDKLRLGLQEVFADSRTKVFLTGAHKGLAFGVVFILNSALGHRLELAAKGSSLPRSSNLRLCSITQ